VKTVITIGGFRIKSGLTEPKVVSTSSNRTILEKMLASGAERSPVGNPVVGFAGLALGLARFRNMKAACLLGETVGYMPDPKAAKAVLNVLRQFLGIALDLSSLDKEIERLGGVFSRMDDLQQEMEILAKERAEIEGGKITYIS
jgi:proteasome assembly chaperone (PAC2) family protein